MRSQRVKRVKRSKKSKMLKRKQINRRTKRVSRVKRSKRSRRSQINRRTRRTRRTRRMRGGGDAGGAAGGESDIQKTERIFNNQLAKARELIKNGNPQEALELLTKLSTLNKPGWSPKAPAIEIKIQKLIAIAQTNLGQSTEMGESLRQKAVAEAQQVEFARQAKAAQQRREADAKAKATAATAALEQRISSATPGEKEAMDSAAISEINRLKSKIETLTGKDDLSTLKETNREGLMQLIRDTKNLKEQLDIRYLISRRAGRFGSAIADIQVEFNNLMKVLRGDHTSARNEYVLPSIPE